MPKLDIERFQRNAKHVIDHPRLVDVLDELDRGGAAIQQAKDNPVMFLEKHGIDLPGKPNVTFKEGSFIIKWCWRHWCITISREKDTD